MNLDSLRIACVQQAQADADRLRAEIEAEHERRLAAARAQARALVEQGKVEGRSVGEQEAARRLGVARRAAREALLAARGALYEQLRSRARAESRRLRANPDYAALVDRLAAAARAQLGAAAELDIDPPAGGVFGRSGNRSVDYTLPSLVDRALADLDGEVEKLWL